MRIVADREQQPDEADHGQEPDREHGVRPRVEVRHERVFPRSLGGVTPIRTGW